MTDIMRVSEDYDDSEYNLYLILQGFQHGIMVTLAEWLRRKFVALVHVGSNPTRHPIQK